jgi:hypothetical protein
MRWLFLFFLGVFYSQALALNVYIKTSSFQIGTATVYKTTIRQDTLTSLKPSPYFAQQPGNVILNVFNLDTIGHELKWTDQQSGVLVAPNGSVTLVRNISGLAIYTLSCADFSAKTLGASFSIVSGVPGENRFYWELWDIESPLSAAIANQTIATPLNPYRPNVFTINGYDYPLNQNDSLGMVEANVADTIYICVVNAGNMPHAMHFHGFHYQILFSLQQPERHLWVKDSGPIFIQDAMILKVVPDKPGAYPVHDHNLTANTSNGGYAGGMMTMLMIDP